MAKESSISKAVGLTRRPDVVDALRQELKALGLQNSDIEFPNDADSCIQILGQAPLGLLVVDWDYGPAEVVRVLLSSRKQYKIEIRPTLLLSSKWDENIILTGAEYGVSQVIAGDVSREKLAERLQNIVRNEAASSEFRAQLIKVAAARGNNDWAAAQGILESLHEQHPDNPRIAAELAENFAEQELWDDALRVIEPIAKTEPPYARAMHILGRCLMKKGRFSEAAGIMGRAKVINPYNVDRLVDLGHSFLKTGDFASAKENFTSAQNLDDTHKDANLGVTTCMLIEGDVNDALTLLNEMASPRELASVFNSAAVFAMRKGQFDQGQNLYHSAIKALGDNPQISARVYFNMGIGFIRMKKNSDALQSFEKAIQLDPRFEKARDNVVSVMGRMTVNAMTPPGSGAAPQSTGSESFSFAEYFDDDKN